MAFPTTPLPIVIELFIGGGWIDITDYVYVRDRIKISRGFRDEGGGDDPSSCELTLNNRDGRFSPRNPTGPYYGNIGRNTPLRIRIDQAEVAADDQTRFVGEVSEWPPRWDVSGRDVWVPITAQGVLRRLGQGDSPARSPLTSAILANFSLGVNFSTSLLAYWPMESGAARGAYASGLPGGSPLTIAGTTPTETVGPLVGSAPIPVLAADTKLSGTVPESSTGEFCVFAVMDFPPTITWADPTPILWAHQSTNGSTVATWEVRFTVVGGTNRLQIRALDASGASLASSTSSSLTPIGTTIAQAIVAIFSDPLFGESVSIWYVDDDGTVQVSGSTAFLDLGVATFITSVDVAPTGGLADLGVGQVGVSSNAGFITAIGFDDNASGMLSFAGESAGTRAERVCSDLGLPFVGIYASSASETALVGEQATPSADSDNNEDATPLGLLAECAAADMALIFETRDDRGITFRSRASLCNQDATLTLDYTGAGEMAPDLEPTDDDQSTVNDWTVKGKQGGEAHAIDSTSRMGAQDPEDGGIGRYDAEVTVNVDENERLEDHAGFRLRVSTWDESRWPTVPLDLAALAKNGKWSLIAAIAALDVGDRLDAENLPTHAGATDNTAQLLAFGFEETLGPFDWNIAINSRPYGPWRIQKLANASPDLSEYVGRAAGNPDAAIRADINSSTTSIPFDPNMFRWTVTSSHFNTSNWPAMQVRLNHAQGVDGGGELLTVSSIATTAATYVAAGAASHADNAAVTPALYAGDAQNDWVCVLARKSGTSGSLATPTGYTLLAKQGLLYLWARVRGSSSPGNPTVTPSGGSAGDTVSAVTFGLRNMPITLSLDRYVLNAAKQSNSSAQNIAYLGRADPGVYPGVVQLLLAGKSDDDTGIAPPSGFTEAIDATTTTGNDQSLWVGYRIDTTPTAVDPGSLVVTGGAAAVSDSMLITLAGGYQTMTATRAANDVTKAHSAGTLVALEHPLIQAL